jgi:hypothetical protein
MMSGGAFILLKSRIPAAECPKQAERRLAGLVKMPGNNARGDDEPTFCPI